MFIALTQISIDEDGNEMEGPLVLNTNEIISVMVDEEGWTMIITTNPVNPPYFVKETVANISVLLGAVSTRQ